MSNPTTFELDIAPTRANTGLIEKSIQASLQAMIGAETSVIVSQKNDRTLEVSIFQRDLQS